MQSIHSHTYNSLESIATYNACIHTMNSYNKYSAALDIERKLNYLSSIKLLLISDTQRQRNSCYLLTEK